MLRGSVTMLVFIAVLSLDVRWHGIPRSFADESDQNASDLVGTWKPLKSSSSLTIEFGSDGSLRVAGPGHVTTGSYAWTGTDTITLNNDEGRTAEALRVRIENGILHTIDSMGKVEDFERVKPQRVVAAEPRAHSVDSSQTIRIYASAPPTLSTADLGRPCDDSFGRIPGKLGGPIYHQKQGTAAGSAGFQYDFLEASDTRELRANAEGWGIISGSIERAKQRRYLVYRASQQSDILAVDDTEDPLHEWPPNAKWYIASIFVGRSYEIAVQGDKSKFTAKVKAKLVAFDLGGGSLNEKGYLHITARGRGLVPRQDADGDGIPDDALFLKSAQGIEKAYKSSGQPVPMYVEYRSIPGRVVSVPEKLEWISEPEPDDVIVEPDPVGACYCGASRNIVIQCVVRNRSGRAMDITVGATALTGSMGYGASGATRMNRIPAHDTATVSVDAHIDGAWFNCSSCGNATCKLNAMYPSQ